MEAEGGIRVGCSCVPLCRECMWPLTEGHKCVPDVITDHDAGDEDDGKHKQGAD